MEKIYVKDDGRFRELAEEVIASAKGSRLVDLDLDDVLFAAVEGDSGDYLAKAIKIPKQFRIFVNASFLIVFNTMMIEAQNTQKNLDLIMYHELLHVDQIRDKLREHDVEDFSSMIKDYGLEWAHSEGQNIVDLETQAKFASWLNILSKTPEKQAEEIPTDEEIVRDFDKAVAESHAKLSPTTQERLARAFNRPMV